MAKESDMKSYHGFNIVNRKGNYRYETEQKKPLIAIIKDKGEYFCQCGGMLVMLYYKYNDGEISSINMAGKKCNLCGRNYFSSKCVKNKERFFQFVSYEEFIKLEEGFEHGESEQLVSIEDKNLCEYSKDKQEKDYTIEKKQLMDTNNGDGELKQYDIEPTILEGYLRSGKIPPVLPDLNTLETLASEKIPTDEGAWWIMLQTAMSIFNYAVKRDPINNKVLDCFWGELLDKDKRNNLAEVLSEIKSKKFNRPLPYDDLMMIIDYCYDQIKTVVENPRHSIIKVDKMVMPYRVQSTGRKTMDWLGKQPGKTIKEKLSGKNKILTQVNEYSYDIKENQITMMLYRQLMRMVNNRINNGISKNGYDKKDIPEISKMLKLKKILRESNLASITPKNHTVVNNVLLVDKNYSIIWKAYLEIFKYDKRITEKWANALDMYTYSVYITMCSLITSCTDVNLIEKRIDFSTDSGKKFECIVDGSNPLYISIYVYQYMINIEFGNVDDKGVSILNRFELTFTANSKCNISEKRGFPIIVTINTLDSEKKLKIWGDSSGIGFIIDWFVDKVNYFYGHSIQYNTSLDENYIGTCTYDVLSNGEYVTVDDKVLQPFYNFHAVVYENDTEEIVYKAERKNYYPGVKDIITIADAVGQKLRTDALMYSLEAVRNCVDLRQDDYFIYTVPDSLEEFSQYNLKQCVNSWFPRSFPVWRSVAALTEILENDKESFKSTDCIISLDLMGENISVGLLKLKKESKINGYVCNHYPPFPEIDSGEKVTEYAFQEKYLENYCEKYNLNIDNNTKKSIVNLGIVKRILLAEETKNYSYMTEKGVCIIKIKFDMDLINSCKYEWIDNFKHYWIEISTNFSREYKIQFVNILNDCIMKFISCDEIKNIIKLRDDFIGIYMSTSKDINRGAYVFANRLRQHLPTWTEYLPKLSLEVIRNGHYEELELIGDNVSFDVMGKQNEHTVHEKLLLKAGEKGFTFPLKKEDISRKAAIIEAYVTDTSFPLEKNIKVELMVRYKYGYDNSYELILKPLEKINAPFEEIIVEWKSVQRKKKVGKYPIYPELNNEEKVLGDIDSVKDSLNRTKNTIERFLVNYEYENVKRLDFDRLGVDITKQIFTIRNIIIHDEMLEVEEFIDYFYRSDLLFYLEEIASMIENKNIPNKFFEDFGSLRGFANLVCSAMQLIYSFGAKTPIKLQTYLINNYDRINVVHKDNVLLNMFYLNTKNTDIMNLIIRESANHNKMDACIKEISSLCWFDSKMIFKLYEYPVFLKSVIQYIKKWLDGKAKIKNPSEKHVSKAQKKRFLRYVEMILAILRLREIEEFNLLEVDSKEARKLAESIRIVDDMMKVTPRPISKIKFSKNIKKPEALRNMSDLAYAVDMYLTGNEGVDAIEVVGVEAD